MMRSSGMYSQRLVNIRNSPCSATDRITHSRTHARPITIPTMQLTDPKIATDTMITSPANLALCRRSMNWHTGSIINMGSSDENWHSCTNNEGSIMLKECSPKTWPQTKEKVSILMHTMPVSSTHQNRCRTRLIHRVDVMSWQRIKIQFTCYRQTAVTYLKDAEDKTETGSNTHRHRLQMKQHSSSVVKDLRNSLQHRCWSTCSPRSWIWELYLPTSMQAEMMKNAWSTMGIWLIMRIASTENLVGGCPIGKAGRNEIMMANRIVYPTLNIHCKETNCDSSRQNVNEGISASIGYLNEVIALSPTMLILIMVLQNRELKQSWQCLVTIISPTLVPSIAVDSAQPDTFSHFQFDDALARNGFVADRQIICWFSNLRLAVMPHCNTLVNMACSKGQIC